MNQKSRIVISDVHGCYKTLMALIAQFPPGVPLTFVGDLIDRGPMSAQVIDFVMNGFHDCVVGNHEVMMLEEAGIVEYEDFDPLNKVMRKLTRLQVDYRNGIWIMNGGDKALESYKIPQTHDPLTLQELDPPHSMLVDHKKFQEHLTWLANLPIIIQYDNIENARGQKLLVSHSTCARYWDTRDGTAEQQSQFEQSTIWDRKDIPSKIPGYYNIYGHTPQEVSPTIKEHFACIDRGAYLKNYGYYSKMCAIQYPEMIVYEQENVDDMPDFKNKRERR